jgi:hypothetical protein
MLQAALPIISTLASIGGGIFSDHERRKAERKAQRQSAMDTLISVAGGGGVSPSPRPGQDIGASNALAQLAALTGGLGEAGRASQVAASSEKLERDKMEARAALAQLDRESRERIASTSYGRRPSSPSRGDMMRSYDAGPAEPYFGN